MEAEKQVMQRWIKDGREVVEKDCAGKRDNGKRWRGGKMGGGEGSGR